MRRPPVARRTAAGWLTAWAAAVLLVLAGCVSIPTSGPVEQVGGEQPTCESCVNVEVAPPAPGDDQQTIVENFLLANDSYQPGYGVARQFLTEEAASSWDPDEGVTVYTRTKISGSDQQVTVTGDQTGYLDRDRTYTAAPVELRREFRLERERGEWRISDPLPGLLVQQYSFATFYKPYDLFFIGSSGTLAPQSIHLPNLRNPDNFASALVRALLGGPSSWLEPAVSTAVPPGTGLSVESVTIEDGVAQVPLTREVLQLDDRDRTLLAGQLVYTLQQVTGVRKVLLLADSQPLQVPQSEPDGLAVPVEAVPAELDPIPYIGTEELYAVQRSGVLGRVNLDTDLLELTPLSGELGEGRYPIDSLAVSAVGAQLALVTDGGTVLRRGTTGGGTPTTVLRGVRGLLRPQLTRDGQLWAVGERDGRQQVWTVDGNGRAAPVGAASVLSEGRVTAFAISPDGTRMAALVRRGGRTRLGLARIVRAEATTVEAWDELLTTGNASTPGRVARADFRDVAWTDATNLEVLRATSAGGLFVPTAVSDDASSVVVEAETTDWDPQQLAVLLRTKTAVLASSDGQVYRDDGAAWRMFLSDVDVIASPG